MANCPKCSGNSDHPLKTWKIKQTTIALYECPSCKTKWRGKPLAEATTIQQTSLEALPAITTSLPATEVAKKIDVMKPVEVSIKNSYTTTSSSISPFSGIRKFLTSFFTGT